MSNILFISRYYLPEKAAAAVCVSETAKRLAQQGHQVTVLTTVPHYPRRIVPSPYQNRLLQEEHIDGVRVIRVWSYIHGNKGFLRRILAQLSFGRLAPLLAWKKEMPSCPLSVVKRSPKCRFFCLKRLLSLGILFMKRGSSCQCAKIEPLRSVQISEAVS